MKTLFAALCGLVFAFAGEAQAQHCHAPVGAFRFLPQNVQTIRFVRPSSYQSITVEQEVAVPADPQAYTQGQTLQLQGQRTILLETVPGQPYYQDFRGVQFDRFGRPVYPFRGTVYRPIRFAR